MTSDLRSNIRSISLASLRVENVDLSWLESFPSLEEFELQTASLTKVVTSTFRRCKTLLKLHLLNCRGIGDADLEELAELPGGEPCKSRLAECVPAVRLQGPESVRFEG